MPLFPLIAVDVGNSRTKLGCFSSAPPSDGLPSPAATLDLVGVDWPTGKLRDWIVSLGDAGGDATWAIGSVNRAAADRLETATTDICPTARTNRLCVGDLPLVVRVPSPEGVGIDRLLGAVAANRVRSADQHAVVVHVGTAISVNLVATDGAFVGGAILPGIGLSAQALHDYTDLLPRIDMIDLAEPPPVVGTDTEAAIRSGLFWGAVGAMRDLVRRLAATVGAKPAVLLTGGAAPSVARLLGEDVRYEPHLVLAGIALAVAECETCDDVS